MIIYCDTSFLVSLFAEDDINHQAARKSASHFDGHDFVLCQVHQLELPASVRAATHRTKDALPIQMARVIINRFDRAWNGRIFLRRDLPIVESVTMARSLGDTYGWKRRHTAFDLWHLAAAWVLGAGVFLTFDERQKEICKFLSLKTS